MRELAPVDLSERCATAAALHDVVEDTAVGLDDLASMGFDDAVIAAVDSVTGREGEPYIELVRRAAADPVGRWVKLADNLDNSDETRLARLPEATAARLREKYASARWLLRAACAVGADARAVTSRNPLLLRDATRQLPPPRGAMFQLPLTVSTWWDLVRSAPRSFRSSWELPGPVRSRMTGHSNAPGLRSRHDRAAPILRSVVHDRVSRERDVPSGTPEGGAERCDGIGAGR